MHEKLIVFDLGGVLASLGRPAEQMELGISNDDFWSVWLNSATVTALETGAITETEFFERFRGELGVSESGREFRQRFLRWRLALFPGVVDMLRDIGETHKVALLSNTNPIHWNMIDSDGSFRRLFDHVFLSFEIGIVKPHCSIFEHILSAVQMDPGRVVFLDDTAKNVEAAANMGFHSLHVTGPINPKQKLGLVD